MINQLVHVNDITSSQQCGVDTSHTSLSQSQDKHFALCRLGSVMLADTTLENE